jgi:hypothetical protein
VLGLTLFLSCNPSLSHPLFLPQCISLPLLSPSSSLSLFYSRSLSYTLFQAIDGLTKLDVAEIRTMVNPPAAVEVVLEAVMVLLTGINFKQYC